MNLNEGSCPKLLQNMNDQLADSSIYSILWKPEIYYYIVLMKVLIALIMTNSNKIF